MGQMTIPSPSELSLLRRLRLDTSGKDDIAMARGHAIDGLARVRKKFSEGSECRVRGSDKDGQGNLFVVRGDPRRRFMERGRMESKPAPRTRSARQR